MSLETDPHPRITYVWRFVADCRVLGVSEFVAVGMSIADVLIGALGFDSVIVRDGKPFTS